MAKFYSIVKKLFRQYSSPAFLLLLLLSTIFWYMTKLSYTYTAEIPVKVNVENNNFKVYCVATGTGYQILGHRMMRNKALNIKVDDLVTTPSAGNKNSFVINPVSLQTIISLRYSDMSILFVGDIPEITIQR